MRPLKRLRKSFIFKMGRASPFENMKQELTITLIKLVRFNYFLNLPLNYLLSALWSPTNLFLQLSIFKSIILIFVPLTMQQCLRNMNIFLLLLKVYIKPRITETGVRPKTPQFLVKVKA